MLKNKMDNVEVTNRPLTLLPMQTLGPPTADHNISNLATLFSSVGSVSSPNNSYVSAKAKLLLLSHASQWEF